MRRLDLSFDTFEGRPNQPIVQILIDGEDLFAGGRASEGFVGFDPRKILETGALIPAEPPRRVAVYRCGCGEAGCGCVAPVIERQGGLMVWSDPRDFVGVYVSPIYDARIESEGSLHDFGDLVFDAEQYLAEADRATQDRS